MKISKPFKSKLNINKIIKKECFFKNYDKIQQALKIVKPIKLNCIEKKELNSSNDNDDDLNVKNRLVKELDSLLDRYSKNERKNMTQYKNMKTTNNLFLSSYHLLRSNNSDNHIVKQQFDQLISKYKQNKYNLPPNVTQRNVFYSTPLVMTKFDDVKIYYCIKANKKNKIKDNKAKEKIKCASYLENISEYLNYVKDVKENKGRTRSAVYLANYSKAMTNDKEKKEMLEKNKCQREIKQSKKDIHDIKETIITLEKRPINSDMIDLMNLTRRSDICSRSKGRSRFSPDTTRTSFFKQKNNEALLLTGNRKTQIPMKNIPHFSKQNTAIVKRNSLSSFSQTKRDFTTSRTLLEVSKLKVHEMYNITKGSSLFNNADIAKNIVKYFKHQNKHVNLNPKRIKSSSQLYNVVSSTKSLIQSVNIKNIINSLYSTKTKDDIGKTLSFVDKIDQKLNKIDYDIFKCALVEKEDG